MTAIDMWKAVEATRQHEGISAIAKQYGRNGEIEALYPCTVEGITVDDAGLLKSKLRHKACTYVENLITAEITEQMTAAAGYAECAISVYEKESYIASWTFNIKVDTAVIVGDKIASTIEYKAIINALQEVEKSKDTVEEATILAATAMKTANDTIGIANQVKEEATAAAAASKEAVKVATAAAEQAQNYKGLIEDIYNNIDKLNDFAEEAWLDKSYLGSGYLSETTE